MLSVSQLKTYNASPPEWAGIYILWIKKEYQYEDPLALWNLFESWILSWKDNYSILDNYKKINLENVISQYDTLKLNYTGDFLPKWECQKKLHWFIEWEEFIWYADYITNNTIVDIKTSYYLSKEWWYKNSWSWLSYREEYALQLRVYMKLYWCKSSWILEVAKHNYKKKGKGHSWQYIKYELNKDFDAYWSKRVKERVDWINSLKTKYILYKNKYF